MTNPLDPSLSTFPTNPESMTFEWMDQALRGSIAVQGASIRSIGIKDYKIGKGMTGHIARFSLTYDREMPGAERTMVVKFSSPLEIGKILGIYEREVRFYAEIAHGIPLRSPRCYYAAYNPENGASILLMEDLDGFQNGNWNAGCTPDMARQAIREIAVLHATYWENAQIAEMNWLFRYRSIFPDGAAKFAVDHWEAFCEGMKLPPSETVQQAGKLVVENIDRVMLGLASPPITLVHNDYQLDNLFFGVEAGQQTIVIADWALLTGLKGVTDVSFFLCGNLSPEDRRASEVDLLKDYLVALEKAGVHGYSFEQCLADYKQAAILHFFRMIFAIVDYEETFDFWSPIVSRFLAAITDFYFEYISRI